jgi:hypothetical protein
MPLPKKMAQNQTLKMLDFEQYENITQFSGSQATRENTDLKRET